MKLDDLLYFYTVSKHNSINIAAEQLHVSQPAVSMGIKRLEQELDVVLTTRTYRGVVLTDVGTKIAQQIAIIFTAIETIQDIAQEYTHVPIPSKPVLKPFTVNTQEVINKQIPPEIITSLCKNHFLPILKTSFVMISSIRDALFWAEKDLALFYIEHKNYLPHDLPENIGVEIISTSKLHLIASTENDNFFNITNVSYKEILQYPLICPYDINNKNNIGAQLIAPLFNYGKPNIITYCENVMTIHEIVAATECVSIVFKGLNSTNNNRYEKICYIPIKDSRKYSLVALYRKDNPNITAIRLVISALQKLV